MLRTKAVKLTVIPAMAFRVKMPGGPSITIQRADYQQPGIASISRTSGEAIPSKNTNTKMYPPEAFAEAIKLTNGLKYTRQKDKKGVKVTKDMFKEKKAKPVEEVALNEEAYQMIVDRYTDKKGNFSYDLMNKEFIRFAKTSSVVRDMVAENQSAAKIRNYVVYNKIRNITGMDLSDKEIKKIVEKLDEAYPKGVFKDLNEEIKRMLSASKKKK